jgi:hypothetical protein
VQESAMLRSYAGNKSPSNKFKNEETIGGEDNSISFIPKASCDNDRNETNSVVAQLFETKTSLRSRWADENRHLLTSG